MNSGESIEGTASSSTIETCISNPVSTVDEALQAEFEAVFVVADQYSMCGRERLQSLYFNARKVAQLYPDASFVDCGVAAGGSSAVLAAALSKSEGSRGRKVYCFDTFKGLPAPGVHDTREGSHANDLGWGEGTCAADVSLLLEVSKKLGVEQWIYPVPGFFAETIPTWSGRVGKVAFLHMDGDWYDSTLQILEGFYHRVTDQGVIQIDDYGYWDGCRKAVHEYFNGLSLEFVSHTIDSTGVLVNKAELKGKTK